MQRFVAADDGFSTGGDGPFHRLPEEVWLGVASHLSAVDVLSLLCVNRRLSIGLGRSANLWKMLSDRDGRSCYKTNDQNTNYLDRREERSCNNSSSNYKNKNKHHDDTASWRTEKDSYLFNCLKSDPSEAGGGVRWHPVHPYGNIIELSSGERQLSCVLSRRALNHHQGHTASGGGGTAVPPRERIIVIHGRFLMDSDMLYIHAGTGVATGSAEAEGGVDSPEMTSNDRRTPRWNTRLIAPAKPLPPNAYGASLTALPTIYSEPTTDIGTGNQSFTATMRALRFGGFRSDRHASETSRCVLMTVTQSAVRKRKKRRRQKRDKEHSGGGWSGQWERWHWNDDTEVRWKTIPTTGIPPADAGEDRSEYSERASLARAYHTATLLLDRYLVVIGGMKSRFSILDEAVLDTHTWTWIGNVSIACGSDEINSRPSGRHGHSVIFDDARNRLVLFGGGSGLDLFRSGEDNSEVWELQLGEGWHDNEKFEESFPWRWKKLHEDSNGMTANDKIYLDTGETSKRLSPSESLCLGRCHHGIKISRDTALFVFGSGRPSTNGLLAYDLKTDAFFRKEQSVRVRGIVPQPRLAGVAAFLEEDGYILTHGGYSGPSSSATVGTMDVLDLAPKGRRNKNSNSNSNSNKDHHRFDGLVIDERRISFPEVTDSEARLMRHEPDAALQRMLRHVMSLPVPERQPMANVMLIDMRRGRRPSNEQSLLVMSVIATCNPNWLGDGDEEVEEDDPFAELYRELEGN